MFHNDVQYRETKHIFLQHFLTFLARDSIYAIVRSLLTPVRLSVCPSVCLSVPLSVTRVDQSKYRETKHIFLQHFLTFLARSLTAQLGSRNLHRRVAP